MGTNRTSPADSTFELLTTELVSCRGSSCRPRAIQNFEMECVIVYPVHATTLDRPFLESRINPNERENPVFILETIARLIRSGCSEYSFCMEGPVAIQLDRSDSTFCGEVVALPLSNKVAHKVTIFLSGLTVELDYAFGRCPPGKLLPWNLHLVFEETTTDPINGALHSHEELTFGGCLYRLWNQERQ